jgi:hypothetical protein
MNWEWVYFFLLFSLDSLFSGMLSHVTMASRDAWTASSSTPPPLCCIWTFRGTQEHLPTIKSGGYRARIWRNWVQKGGGTPVWVTGISSPTDCSSLLDRMVGGSNTTLLTLYHLLLHVYSHPGQFWHETGSPILALTCHWLILPPNHLDSSRLHSGSSPASV